MTPEAQQPRDAPTPETFARLLEEAASVFRRRGPMVAESEALEVLSVAREIWGDDDPRVGAARLLVGRIYEGLGRDMPGMETAHHDEPALEHLQEAEAIHQRSGGGPALGSTLALKAAVLRRRGRTPLAQRDARLALNTLPEGHDDTARARAVLGGALLDDGDAKAAVEALAPLRHAKAPIRTWSEAMRELATALAQAGQADEGVVVMGEVLSRWRARDATASEVHDALEELEALHARRKDWTALRDTMVERKAFYSAVHGEQSTATADLLAELARVHERMGDERGAHELQAQAQAMMKRVFTGHGEPRMLSGKDPTSIEQEGLGWGYVIMLVLFTIGVVVGMAWLFSWLES